MPVNKSAQKCTEYLHYLVDNIHNLISYLRSRDAKRDGVPSRIVQLTNGKIQGDHTRSADFKCLYLSPTHLAYYLVHFEWGCERHREKREGEWSPQETLSVKGGMAQKDLLSPKKRNQHRCSVFTPWSPLPSSLCLLLPSVSLTLAGISNYCYAQAKRHKSK